jgi:hypothetical protein
MPTQPVVAPSPTPRTVVVSQEFVDDATKAFTEVVALRDALAKVVRVNGLSTAERAAMDDLVASLDKVISIRGKMNDAYAMLDDVRLKTIQAQGLIIDRLMTQLNKPRSAFQKFLAAAEKVLYLAAGVALGRGF